MNLTLKPISLYFIIQSDKYKCIRGGLGSGSGPGKDSVLEICGPVG